MSKNHRRFKMDFLSSSSEDEKPMGIKSEYVLEDSSTSSEEDIHVPKSSRNKNSRTIEDLSSALSSIKIGDNTHTKSIISISDDSSDDDDSILKYKSPFKLTSKPITLDDSSDDDDSILNYKSPFKSKSKTITLDDDSSHEGGKTRSNKKKSKGPWRFSLSKKEYTLSETTDSVVPKFRIPGVLFDKLYSHQKEGVAWLAGLHTGGMGGLLG
jgi:SNF2 family DNA or RNA helicase